MFLPEDHAAKLFTMTIPEPYFNRDTISMQNSVLELFRNLQLGEDKNVYEATCSLSSGSNLPANFGRQDYFMSLKTLTVKPHRLSK